MSPPRGDSWTIEEDGHGSRWASSAGFRADGIVHGFGLRDGSPLPALGLDAAPVARIRQVHGATLLHARAGGPTDVEADGVWARTRELDSGGWIGVRTADCVPILLATRDGSRIAAVHAGWRGTAARIAARAVARLGADGCDPARLVAALGPAIGACCYEVDDAVGRAVTAASGGTGRVTPAAGAQPRVDLRAANRSQLAGAGIPPEAIFAAPWCTACEALLLHSWRRDGERAGRQISVVGRGPRLA